MAKRIGEMSDFVASSLVNQITAAISAVLDQTTAVFVGPYLIVNPVVNGTVTNTSINVSVGIKDANNIITWSAPQTLSLRTLPDTTKVFEWGIFSAFRSQQVYIALETAITGGGSVTVYYATGV